MPDPLRCLLSGQQDNPTSAEARAPHLGNKAWCFTQADASGKRTALHFDNNVAIALFEENLEDLKKQFGVKHAAVAQCAEGLAVLYETRAALEKDAAHYDTAISLLELAAASREAIFGQAAAWSPESLANEAKREYLAFKRDKRKAKGVADSSTTTVAVPPRPLVTQVHADALQTVGDEESVVIEFYSKDGNDAVVFRTGPIHQPDHAEEDPFNLIGKEEKESISSYRYDKAATGPFFLEDDEHLVGIFVREKGRHLTGMQVQTNLGRRSDWFQFDIREPQGRLRGIFAQAGQHVVGLAHDNGVLRVPVEIVQGGLS
mmetsp:Transcript_71551/g.133784  ORF Transcript_71551/g.133784 Transcript_71551/m.133784 type:complete len:317 (-) Transcript_71551:42-992(-)